jgi:hypothetical protein
MFMGLSGTINNQPEKESGFKLAFFSFLSHRRSQRGLHAQHEGRVILPHNIIPCCLRSITAVTKRRFARQEANLTPLTALNG